MSEPIKNENNIVAAGIDDVSGIVAEFIGRYEF